MSLAVRLACAALLALATAAPAQEAGPAPGSGGGGGEAAKAAKRPPLRMRLVQQGARSGAPTGLELELDWAGPDPVEGRLQLACRDGERLLLELETREIPLAPGVRRVPLMLPALRLGDDASLDAYVTLEARFVTPRGTHRLDPQVVSLPLENESRLLVALSDPWRDAGGQRAEPYLRFAPFERLHPGDEDHPVATRFVRPAPPAFPASALELARFDLVLLVHDGFALLEAAHLDAVARWVEAGGAVLVAPEGGLREHHYAFLNRLAASAGLAGRFAPRDGAHAWGGGGGAGEGGPAILLRSGLGRAVVVLRPPGEGEELEGPAWDGVVHSFLWRERRVLWTLRFPRLSQTDLGEAEEIERALASALMPRTVRLIPFWTLVAILGAFVLVVGPLDYLVLGLLRRRRLTWITFPLASAAFTLLLTGLSRQYLGGSSQARSLIVVDVGPDGVPRRENRFELIFPAAPRRASHEVEGELFVPLAARGAERDPLRLRGAYPARYAVDQDLLQWKPVVNRALSFEPRKHGLEPRWEAIEEDVRRWLRREAPLGEDAVARLLDGQELRGRIVLLHRGLSLEWRPERPELVVLDDEDVAGASGGDRRGLLERLSWHPPAGRFTAVSAVSPAGAASLEDLALLDPTDLEECLLVVEHRAGDDVLWLRKLYRGGE